MKTIFKSKHGMAKERALDRMKTTGKGRSQKKLDAYNFKKEAAERADQ